MIVLLIATRDEADLLRLNLEHHLAWGVDHVAVADNHSSDATQDVIRSFGDSVSTLAFEGDISRRLPALVEAFARVEERHGKVAWAGVSDTDELWWSPEGTMGSILAGVPGDVIGANFDQKLFLPTELDRDAGPVFCRRIYRTSGGSSPLHTSYVKGKSFYRGAWIRERGLTGVHWCEDIPHPPWRGEHPLVHHYMIDDEDGFVAKVRRLELLWPRIRDGAAVPIRPFKIDWWRLYVETGEDGLREYFRSRYRIGAGEIPRLTGRGELVLDTAFSDFTLSRAATRGGEASEPRVVA